MQLLVFSALVFEASAFYNPVLFLPKAQCHRGCSDRWIAIILMKYIEDILFRNLLSPQSSFSNAIIRNYGWVYVALFPMLSWDMRNRNGIPKNISILCHISNFVHSMPEIFGHAWRLCKNSGSVLIFTSCMIQPVCHALL